MSATTKHYNTALCGADWLYVAAKIVWTQRLNIIMRHRKKEPLIIATWYLCSASTPLPLR